MMSENDLLISSFRKVEELKPGIKTYAYNTGNWIEFAVDDYDFYCNNNDFKLLQKQIRDDFFNKFGLKIVFVYRASPENVLDAFKEKLKEKGKELIGCP